MILVQEYLLGGGGAGGGALFGKPTRLIELVDIEVKIDLGPVGGGANCCCCGCCITVDC